jgi:hypothetical protein
MSAATVITAAALVTKAKMDANAAEKAARIQSGASTYVGSLQATSAANQLAYVKRQAELDKLSKRFSDKQNYGLSRAEMNNEFGRYGDTSFNTRAIVSCRKAGRRTRCTAARQNQMNYMRSLLNMPQNELSVYVEPDALQLTRPTMPDYVDDTTPTE